MDNKKNEENIIDEPSLIKEDKPVEFSSFWMGVFFLIVVFVATLVAYMGNAKFNIFNVKNIKDDNTGFHEAPYIGGDIALHPIQSSISRL